MKHLTLLLSCVLILMLSGSCMTHRHTVGDGPVGKRGTTKIYSKAKQAYLFWGLVPLGRPQPSTPRDGNYQIKTSSNAGDAILSVVTLGICSFRTVRVLVLTDDPNSKYTKKSKRK